MDNRNIYGKKEDRDHAPEQLPVVDLTLEQARKRTIRNTVGFAVIVLLLLGGTSIWIAVQEQRIKELTETQAQQASPSLPATTNRPPATPIPFSPTIRLPAPGSTEGLEVPFSQRIDSEKMAAAYSKVRLAAEYLKENNLDRAEENARDALALWPDLGAALRLLGVIHTHRGQFEQAIATLDKAMSQDPFNVEIINNLATAYLQKRQFDKAEELFQTALKIKPNNLITHLNLGLLYLLTGRYELSVENLEEALRQAPGNIGPRNNLSVALMRLGRYDEAREQLQLILQHTSDVATAYLNMAITYSLEQRIPEAIEWIRRGSEYCTPVQLQKFLTDPDFDRIRETPEFKQFVQSAFPHPAPPPAPK